jgi:hypothetical protein
MMAKMLKDLKRWAGDWVKIIYGLSSPSPRTINDDKMLGRYHKHYFYFITIYLHLSAISQIHNGMD